jgi:hypothetical protein
MVMKEITIVSRRSSITLQSPGFFELEQRYRRMEGEGWNVEHFPQFRAGKWQVTLFRSENDSFAEEAYSLESLAV